MKEEEYIIDDFYKDVREMAQELKEKDKKNEQTNSTISFRRS